MRRLGDEYPDQEKGEELKKGKKTRENGTVKNDNIPD
jgi:hypothetical protein